MALRPAGCRRQAFVQQSECVGGLGRPGKPATLKDNMSRLYKINRICGFAVRKHCLPRW